MPVCCLKSCANPFDRRTSARVEIKATIPSQINYKVFKISWTKHGDAQFHLECWNTVLKTARSRNVKKALFKMTTVEAAMVKEACKTAEFHDSIDKVISEAKKIAELLRTSRYFVAFTGAGISTSAGIGDYRGKSGKWTEEDRAGDKPRSKFQKMDPEQGHEEDAQNDGVPYESLRPTYTHEALHRLLQLGYVKHIISQNGDGLHGLSGIPDEHLSELHGNVFLERCEKCHTKYYRSSYVLDDLASQYYEDLADLGKTDVKKPKHATQCLTCKLSHRTGRRCDKKGCKGYLIDSIINFGDNLDKDVFNTAEAQCKLCDVLLCLGSTITVTPASDLVDHADKLILCNRQKTDRDADCVGRVFGDCDTLVKEVMNCLLSQKELKQWEKERAIKIQDYNSRRC